MRLTKTYGMTFEDSRAQILNAYEGKPVTVKAWANQVGNGISVQVSTDDFVMSPEAAQGVLNIIENALFDNENVPHTHKEPLW